WVQTKTAGREARPWVQTKMAGREARPWVQTKTAGREGRPHRGLVRPAALVAARSQQLQQHHEQVDEVEVEPERAHDRGLGRGLAARIGLVDIHLLDLLR